MSWHDDATEAVVLNLMHVGMDPEMTTGWIKFFYSIILFAFARANPRNCGEKGHHLLR